MGCLTFELIHHLEIEKDLSMFGGDSGGRMPHKDVPVPCYLKVVIQWEVRAQDGSPDSPAL
jgi:hypothetical protein